MQLYVSQSIALDRIFEESNHPWIRLECMHLAGSANQRRHRERYQAKVRADINNAVTWPYEA